MKPVIDKNDSATTPPISCGLEPFEDFDSASRAVLACLHKRLGFGLWMMTRTEGSDWIVLQAEDNGYNVTEGTVFRWADSFCSQMVLGRGPRVAPRADDIPAYVAAPIGRAVKIGSYIGAPVTHEDGSLFGTLCAIDPVPQEDSIRDALPVVELLARLLGTVLASNLKAVEQARLLEHRRRQAFTDKLTGLLNRRGWEQSVTTEEERSREFGSPACILIIDLDGLKQINDTEGHGAGDTMIRRAADCLAEAVSETDLVARIGGDEFAILAVEHDRTKSEALQRRITEILTSNRIPASVGLAMRDPQKGLTEAMAKADRAMYEDKSKQRRSCLSEVSQRRSSNSDLLEDAVP